MSRTRHHRGNKGRHNGRDLWSRRCSGHLSYCSYNKFQTRRRERAARRRIILKEMEYSS